MSATEMAGWASVALGQIVSWPQVIKLRCNAGEGVSLASYAIVIVSMSLFLVHAIAIGDPVATVSVPLSLVPNALIALTLARRRLTGAPPKGVVSGACGPTPQSVRDRTELWEGGEHVDASIAVPRSRSSA